MNVRKMPSTKKKTHLVVLKGPGRETPTQSTPGQCPYPYSIRKLEGAPEYRPIKLLTPCMLFPNAPPPEATLLAELAHRPRAFPLDVVRIIDVGREFGGDGEEDEDLSDRLRVDVTRARRLRRVGSTEVAAAAGLDGIRARGTVVLDSDVIRREVVFATLAISASPLPLPLPLPLVPLSLPHPNPTPLPEILHRFRIDCRVVGRIAGCNSISFEARFRKVGVVEVEAEVMLKYWGYIILFSYVSFRRCVHDSSGGRSDGREGVVGVIGREAVERAPAAVVDTRDDGSAFSSAREVDDGAVVVVIYGEANAFRWRSEARMQALCSICSSSDRGVTIIRGTVMNTGNDSEAFVCYSAQLAFDPQMHWETGGSNNDK